MTEKSKKFALLIRRITPIYAVLAILIAVSYYFAVSEGFNDVLGHFDPVVWFFLFVGLTIFAAVFAFAFACPAAHRLSVPCIPEAGILEIFAAALSAVMAGAIAVSTVLRVSDNPIKPALPLASAILFVFLAAGLVLSLFPKFRTGLCRTVLLSLGTLAVVLSLFELYFSEIPINNPIRHTSMLIMAFPVLFVIAEARLAFVTPEEPQSRRSTGFFYLLAAGLTASVSAGLALGTALTHFFCYVADDPSLPLLPLGLYFALGLLALSRLAAFGDAADVYLPEKPAKSGKSAPDGE